MTEPHGKENPPEIKMNDPWETLPDEIACEIITRLNNLQEISSYMQTSRHFNRLARRCLQVIDSSTLVRVPLTYFTQFQNLRVIGDNIIVTMRQEEADLLLTLPQLGAVNLSIDLPLEYQEDDYLQFSDYLLSVMLAVLERLNLQRKFPHVNLRVELRGKWADLIQNTTLIFQGHRFGSLKGFFASRQWAGMISKRYPQPQYIQIPRMVDRILLIDRDLRNFLREGDFGLVDPLQPPSEANPPLSVYLRRLSDSGLIDAYVLHFLISIYAWSHGLFSDATIYFDDLMRRYFQPAIIRENERRALHGQGLLALDSVEETKSIDIAGLFTSRRDFTYYDIPTPLSPEERESIYSLIKSTHAAYL